MTLPTPNSYLIKTLLFLTLFALHSQARIIVDDYGREVDVPQNITKIYAASPPLTMSLLAFDANIISALNSPFSKEQKPYVGAAFDKPVVGGFFGQGKSANLELLAASKPEVILVWGRMNGAEKIVDKLSLLDIPVLLVRNDSIKDLLSQFRLYGELTGNRQRAQELIAYTQETLHLIDTLQDKINSSAPIRYYFAEGLEGLNSECEGSFHLEPFLYSGAKNALDCRISSNYGMEKISMEKVLLSKPDVIIAMERAFYKDIYTNGRFSSLEAVKKRDVYLVPSQPFNYITRPPSFMRLMGIRWLIHTFYPDILPQPLEQERKRFEKLFFKEYKL